MDKEIIKILGVRLKQRRLELGLTCDELGALVGSTRSTIYRYEQCINKVINLSVIEQLANALNVSPDYLIGKSNNKEILKPEDDPNPLEITVEELYNYCKYQLLYNDCVTLNKKPLMNEEAKLILQALKIGIEMAKEHQSEILIELDIKKQKII